MEHATRTMLRMAAFIPGASPPLVSTANFLFMLSDEKQNHGQPGNAAGAQATLTCA
jgi:hypothetical protein